MTTTVLTLDSKRWYDPNSSSYKTTGAMKVGYDSEGSYEQIRCSYRFILPIGYADLFITSAVLALTVDADTPNYGYGTDTIIGPHDATTAFGSIDLTPYATVNLLNPKGIEDNYLGYGRDYTVTQGTISVVNVDLTTAVNAAIAAGKIDNGGINIIWDQHPDWYGYDLFGDNNASPTLTLTHVVPPDPSPYGLGDETVLFRGATLATDLGPHENDGTLVGGLTTVADAGEQGIDAFDMDGVDNKLVANTFSTDSEWTVAAWVKINSGNQKGCWIKSNSSASDEYGFGLGIGNTNFDTNGRKLIVLRSGVSWHVSSYTFASDGWHHIAMTRSGTTNKVYVDGVLKYTVAFGSNSDGDKISFGGFDVLSSYYRYCSNRMDDCCQFSRVLSQYEIETLASRRNYDNTWGLNGLAHRYCATLTDDVDDWFGTAAGAFQGSMGTEADAGHGGTKAYAFNDSNDYVSFAEHYSPGTSDFAFSCWFRLDASGTTNKWIYSNYNGNSSIAIFTNSGKIRVLIRDESNDEVRFDSTTTPAANTWYHLAVTWDASDHQARLFINGTYETSAINASIGNVNLTGGGVPCLGAYSAGTWDSNYRFAGGIEDVMIFRSEISDATIASIASNPPGWDGVEVSAVVATIMLDDVTMSAAAVSVVSGESGIVLDDVSMAAWGVSCVSSESTIVLDDVAMDSLGTQLSVARASATITLDDVTMIASADSIVDASSLIILDDVTMVAVAGAVGNASSTITLDDVSMITISELIVVGGASITLDDVSMSAAGESTVTGVSTIVLDNVTLSSGSQTSVSATSTIVLDDVELSIDVPSNNRISVVLDDVTMASIGANIVGADATIVLDDISVTVVAAVSSLTGDDVLFPNDLFPGDLFTTEVFV
ncbi:LamG-like jellyroll fold domain-containing protein [Rhodopirellula sp. SWK7]|uniref:LamG-like jellyroll fold domain-containing protein n=1 Tax=Rhodopirellula sp. SWK7 TaxID=595460 RepID=UPI0002BFB24B|nr:LamG-like jellyroll fold domain-containing protein [Rhodopirellula sp. SWK7]EMI41703.1 hypothetical protein RRSWK_05800 [Rhodopirellula sp. SWK7]